MLNFEKNLSGGMSSNAAKFASIQQQLRNIPAGMPQFQPNRPIQGGTQQGYRQGKNRHSHSSSTPSYESNLRYAVLRPKYIQVSL